MFLQYCHNYLYYASNDFTNPLFVLAWYHKEKYKYEKLRIINDF